MPQGLSGSHNKSESVPRRPIHQCQRLLYKLDLSQIKELYVIQSDVRRSPFLRLECQGKAREKHVPEIQKRVPEVPLRFQLFRDVFYWRRQVESGSLNCS